MYSERLLKGRALGDEVQVHSMSPLQLPSDIGVLCIQYCKGIFNYGSKENKTE